MKLKSIFCLSASSIVGFAGLMPMAANAQTAEAEQAPEEQVAAEPGAEDDVIVVSGYRRSLESAQEIKRSSDAIVDAVVAEDIGKLPDTFASSALQRVSGVTVTRGGGESAGVTVRGLPDLTTTYNGRQIFTAEGRYVQIQDFPAGTVAALEVYKTTLADQIEGGIAGSINVRGRKPFDFNGFELSGSANMVLSEQSQNYAPNGNLLISNRWDTGIGEMGLLLNASYVGIDFLDSTREQALVIATTNSGNAPGNEGLRYPDAQGNFLGYGDRYRPSVNAAFQWKPTPDLEIYVDGLYQGFRSKDYNRWMFIPIFGGMSLTDITTIPGTDKIESMTVTNAVRPDGFTGSFNGKTDTYQFGGGVKWERDRLTVSADLAYTDSQWTADLVNVDYAFADSPVREVVFEADQDGGPTQYFVDYDLTDPDNFISRGLYQEHLEVTGKDWQARGDISYELGEGFLQRLQAGVRFGNRDAGRDFGNHYVNNEGARIPMADLPGAVITTSLPGFAYNNVQPNDFYAAITRDSIRDNLPALRAFFGAPEGLPTYNPTDTFRANEKSYAGYVQAKYGFDMGDIVVDGVVGLRAVKTETTISGFSRIDEGGGVITFPEVTAKSDYTDYLPNVSARIGLTNELQMRLSYTQTRTRPSFFDMRPNTTLGQPVILAPGDPCLVDATTPDCIERLRRGGSAGNPDLKPLTADNFDASLEYFFSRTGSLTAAIFRHDAEGFLANFDDRSQPGLRISRPINLGKTKLQGAEVSFTSFLDFDSFPEWAKGFGIQANATYIDAVGELQPAIAASYDDPMQAFPGVSKWAYNIIGIYEKPQFSARLAYNYRSKFVNYYSYEPLDPIAHPVTEKGRGQLDGSLSITPTENFTIAFDVINILGNPLQRYRQFDTGDSFTRQVIYLERSYSLGVRFRF